MPRNCKAGPWSHHPFRSYTLRRATKGVGRTQPVNWRDAGEALGHNELKGCLMPNGSDNFPIRRSRMLMSVVAKLHREMRER